MHVTNVNLPVTHIPDNPDAAARGTKYPREIAEAAVSITVSTITAAFASGGAVNASQIADAYNTGRSIFESSEAIIDNPTQPHIAEHLAMAAGLVSIAGSTVAGVAVLGQVAGASVSAAASAAGGGGFATGGDSPSGAGSRDAKLRSNFSSCAKSMIASVQGNSDAGEFVNMLGMFTGSGSTSGSNTVSTASSSSSGGKMSFFDMIVDALKKAISGESSSAKTVSTSSSSTSPVWDFLGKFVMD